MNTQKPYLFIMVGLAGSGKSYIADIIQDELGAVVLDSDEVRAIQYDDPKHPDQNTAAHHRTVFRTMDYFCRKCFDKGISVVYDANNNQKVVRDKLIEVAEACDAIPIIVWMKTDPKVSRYRATNRQDGIRSWKMPDQYYDGHAAKFDDPTGENNLVILDGTESRPQLLVKLNKRLHEL
jgi:predicted kinase